MTFQSSDTRLNMLLSLLMLLLLPRCSFFLSANYSLSSKQQRPFLECLSWTVFSSLVTLLTARQDRDPRPLSQSVKQAAPLGCTCC